MEIRYLKSISEMKNSPCLNHRFLADRKDLVKSEKESKGKQTEPQRNVEHH